MVARPNRKWGNPLNGITADRRKVTYPEPALEAQLKDPQQRLPPLQDCPSPTQSHSDVEALIEVAQPGIGHCSNIHENHNNDDTR